MSYLPEPVKMLPLNRVCLPGTHDSAAYHMDFGVSLSNKWVRVGGVLAKCSGRIRRVVSDWSLTQRRSIYEQLLAGIRVIDLRVSVAGDGTFYCSHTFGCVALDGVLHEVAKFVRDHPSEIVIVEVSPDYFNRDSMTTTCHLRVLGMIKSIFGSLLVPPSPTFPSISELVDRGTRVLVFYDPLESQAFDVWSVASLHDIWDDTSDLQTKLGDLQQDLAELPVGTYNMLSMILTPQTSDIVTDVLNRIFRPRAQPGSVRRLSKLIRAYTGEFLEGTPKLLSCLKFDSPSTGNIRAVIDLNFGRPSHDCRMRNR